MLPGPLFTEAGPVCQVVCRFVRQVVSHSNSGLFRDFSVTKPGQLEKAFAKCEATLPSGSGAPAVSTIDSTIDRRLKAGWDTPVRVGLLERVI